jgi:outer membrane protein
MKTTRELSAVAVAVLLLATPGAAQVAARPDSAVALSLEQAVTAALGRSEEVQSARAGLAASQAQVKSARSASLPQIGTQVSYTRALRSVFQSAGGGLTIPDSLKFEPDPTASLDQRVTYLEDRVPTAAIGALGNLFSDLPFGNENTWVAGLTFSQPLFSGGRISSSIDMAEAAEAAAQAQVDEAYADIAVDTRIAYLDAALAGASVDIVAASVELTRQHLERVRLQFDAGQASELDVLRAEVDLENLQPQLVQAQTARDVALLNLKRLTNIPASVEVDLTSPLEPADGGAALREVALPPAERVERLLGQRASLRAAEARVSATEEQVDIARSAYFPTVALTGNLTRQAFPKGTFGFPSAGDWRDDWSVGFAVQWPLFQGLRRRADVDAARSQVRQAELGVAQLREAVRIEYQQAAGELQRTRAQIVAASRTVEQARRVYDLTVMQAFHDARVALARTERAVGAAIGGAEVER